MYFNFCGIAKIKHRQFDDFKKNRQIAKSPPSNYSRN